MGNEPICGDLACCHPIDEATVSFDLLGKQLPVILQDPREDRPERLSDSFTSEQQEEQANLVVPFVAASELFLSLDEGWLRSMEAEAGPSPSNRAYSFSEIRTPDFRGLEVVCTRTGLPRRKRQLLFREHIPKTGNHYFELKMLEFDPAKGYEFAIGVAVQEKAYDQVHSRSRGFEQSYLFVQPQQPDKGPEEVQTTCRIDKIVRVELVRDPKQPEIAFYAGGQLLERQPLRGQLRDVMVVLVPYVQTEDVGLSFSWNRPCPALRRPSLSVITEERSSMFQY